MAKHHVKKEHEGKHHEKKMHKGGKGKGLEIKGGFKSMEHKMGHKK